MPDYNDQAALDFVRMHLGASLPLVSIDEIRRLRAALGRAALGEAFLLQGGDFAEALSDCTPDKIRKTFSTLVEMPAALTLGAGCPVVKVGRIAGQFAKPRSEPTEKRRVVPANSTLKISSCCSGQSMGVSRAWHQIARLGRMGLFHAPGNEGRARLL